MSDVRLENADLVVDVSPRGGTLWRVMAKIDGHEIALLREPPMGDDRNPLQAACFPLVPFANRVRANRFRFEGREYGFKPNMAWDRHYLHGDGWTHRWEVARQGLDAASLQFSYRGDDTPYVYEAEQAIGLRGRQIELSLAVTNRGKAALPFGLGWHPYFPLMTGTRLLAPAKSYWNEDAQWLPVTRQEVSGDLDFCAGAPVPRRWINTQFEDWNGRAAIAWPEQALALTLDADPLFGRYLIFVSDPVFDPAYAFEFFCFEPMSHSLDAHNRADGGGLKRLAPGETLKGTMRMAWARA